MRRVERLKIPGTPSDRPGERDNGKVFVLTEMDAYSGQKWAAKAILAVTSSGSIAPEEMATAGMAGLAAIGVRALLQLPYEKVEPLLDEMLACARYEHREGLPLQAIVPGPNCVVEEIKTFAQLHLALIELHVGFSLAALSSTLGSPGTAAA